jgi:hypothetical protein
MRIQTREDGLSIDQIVLSPATFINTAPGALKNDNTILQKTSGSTSTPPPPPPPPPPTGSAEIVLRATDVTVASGAWRRESDGTGAGGERIRHPDAGAAKISAAAASPVHYFELTFTADSGKPYRIWIRGKAEANSWANDSVFVQFDKSVNSGGSPVWRIGTTSATEMNLEDCSGCGVSEWGWQDNGWGAGIVGPLVYFSYLNTPPGNLKNDTTIIPR